MPLDGDVAGLSPFWRGLVQHVVARIGEWHVVWRRPRWGCRRGTGVVQPDISDNARRVPQVCVRHPAIILNPYFVARLGMLDERDQISHKSKYPGAATR